MEDQEIKQQHHPDCGDVGDVGETGDLGTNAINHPLRIAQATSAADLDAAAAEQKAADAAVPNPAAALAERLVALGYGEDEARRMAASALDQLVARKAGA